jgi:hypothetical protein
MCYGTIPAGYSVTTGGSDCDDNDASIFRLCCTACIGTPTASKKPARPLAIAQSGAATVCPGEIRTYTIATVARACYYIWSLPVGAAIISGDSTNSVTVQYSGGFVANDTISVFGQNGCGNGTARIFIVKRGKAPARPAIPTGQMSGLCMAAGMDYSVSGLPGVSYSWAFSSPLAGTIRNAQGTTITADFDGNWVTGAILITAANSCGTSLPRTVNLRAAPLVSVPVTGPAMVCPNGSGVYSIPAAYGASTYTWTGPAGSSINDGTVTATSTVNTAPKLITTASTVTVTFRLKSGAVRVVAGNDCYDASPKALYVMATCPGPGLRMTQTVETIELFPNPVRDQLNVVFYAADAGNYRISIVDALGREVTSKDEWAMEGSNQQTLEVGHLVTGVYQLTIYGNGLNYREKFVKE